MESLKMKKVGCIIGASRGLGLALVEELYNGGRFDHVIMTVRQESDAQKVKDHLASKYGDSGIRLDVLKCDLTIDGAGPGSIQTFVKELGNVLSGRKLDLMLVNSGVLPMGLASEVSFEEASRCFLTNAHGPVALAEKVMPLMFHAPGERLQNPRTATMAFISSTSSSKTEPFVSHVISSYCPVYAASKGALNHYAWMMYNRWTLAQVGKPVTFDTARSFMMNTANETPSEILNSIENASVSLESSEKLCVVAVHPGHVQTDMGGGRAPLTPEMSAQGVIGTVLKRTEEAHVQSFIDNRPLDQVNAFHTVEHDNTVIPL